MLKPLQHQRRSFRVFHVGRYRLPWREIQSNGQRRQIAKQQTET
ncbi:hypothetical protein ACS15_1259 [Ralstonia insidiosa]|uniref:Uncharacterized protein n=1 Tax=Ralstonia insidiosa TaxID=190721 RepID=A0AAC9BG74_9RALS|nr:hypothetical protein ACS15_1259 [Ralstonia insidiosa]